MSGSYSKETLVCNVLWSYLKKNEYSILQLVAPGSQATLSTRFMDKETNKKKTIFPDLIALRNDDIFIGEIKSNYSISDKLKLLKLRNSVDGEINIKDLVSRILRRDFSNSQIRYFLIHSDINSEVDAEISQMILTKNTFFLK